MAKSTLSIRFYLKPTTKFTEKGYPIYCRLTCNRKKAEFFTGEYIPPEHWSATNGMPIRKPTIRNYLVFLEAELIEKRRELEYQDKVISAKIIRDYYKKGDPLDEIYFCKYFDRCYQRKTERPDEYVKGVVSQIPTSWSYRNSIKYYR